jgi:ribonuclease R
MPDKYADAILKYLADQEGQALKPRQLARQMGVADEDYGSFREAVKELRDAGRIVMGAQNALMLPEMGKQVTGTFRQNPKGFGFVIPEHPNAHGDLFIPPDANAGAMTGDLVRAEVRRKGKRSGKSIYEGRIVEVLRRGQNQFVGVLQKTGAMHFIVPEGKRFNQPIMLRDISEAGPKLGAKVVVEIVDYGSGDRGELPSGVVVETLGEEGELAVETRAVIRAYGLREQFDEATLQNARDVSEAYDPENLDHEREDVAAMRIATIDPADARDYDDAISLEHHDDGTVTLGVHIADVSHFVTPGSPLEEEARARSTSVYFPRRVLPMLPVILSNGVCSLQEGQKRLAKSAFVTYDAEGNVLKTRLAETVIRSTKRLTYEQAQAICDGRNEGVDKKVAKLVRDMEALARKIEARRERAGMLHLDLPAVELVLADDGKVVDARPEDESYSHTIIEMFMVEANEAVARTLTAAGQEFLRRIHPDPDAEAGEELSAFVKACGYKLPKAYDRQALQDLLESARGKPESYAVNLAILKTFQQAEYSPMHIGHFALASDNYAHFTSPIRRYPDLRIHRLIEAYCRGTLPDGPLENTADLVELGEHCSTASRRAESAETELREVLVLQLLAGKVGATFDGVITGVANFGIFVQWPKYLTEGLIRLEDLGDDWWEVDSKTGRVRGEHTGKTYRLGERLEVQITAVDVARRQLNLLPAGRDKSKNRNKGKGGGKSPGGTSHKSNKGGKKASASNKDRGGHSGSGRRKNKRSNRKR